MQYRIGDRDPVTGLYDVIWPDGSATRNGIKIFNSAHEFGDVVLATHRSDGMIILDGVKATVTEVATNNFGLGGFDSKPMGYLRGQVFNNEDEVILPTVSINFAPGSPTELEPGASNFVVRIKINRPQSKDLRVKCELSGTAVTGDYTVVGLDNDRVAIIPAGELFFDFAVTPTQNSAGQGESIEINLLQYRDYRIGEDRTVTATILTTITTVVVSVNFAPGSPNELYSSTGVFTFRVSVNTIQTQNLSVSVMLSGTVPNTSYAVGGLVTGAIVITAGNLFADFTITPTGVSGGITATIAVSSLYTIGSPASADAVVLLRDYRIARFVGIATGGATSSATSSFGDTATIGGTILDAGKQIAFKFKSVDFADSPVPIQGEDLVIAYNLFGAIPNVAYITPPGGSTGTIILPVGSSEVILLIDPILSATTGGTLNCGLGTGYYVATNGTPQAEILPIVTLSIGSIGSDPPAGQSNYLTITRAFEITNNGRWYNFEFVSNTAVRGVDYEVWLWTGSSYGLSTANITNQPFVYIRWYDGIPQSKSVIFRLLSGSLYDVGSPFENTFLVYG